MSRESTDTSSQQSLSSSFTPSLLSPSSSSVEVKQSVPEKKFDKTTSQQSIEQKKEEGLDEKALTIKAALLRGDSKPFCAVKDRRELQEKIIADINFAAMKRTDELTVVEIQTRILEALIGGNYRGLKLAGCKVLTNDRLTAIAKTCTNLVHLDISNCTELSATPIRELSQQCLLLESLVMTGLTKPVHLAKLQFFTRNPSAPLVFPRLQVLKLDGCANLVTIDLDAPMLKTLTIEGCKALPKYWTECNFVALITNSISYLDLSSHKINNDGAKSLAGVLRRNTTLLKLKLGNNYIGSEGSWALSEVLKYNTTLRALDLNDNDLDFSAVKAIATMLEQNVGLRQILIGTYRKTYDERAIDSDSIEVLRKALIRNKTLIRLYLDDGYRFASYDAQSSIQTSLERNRNLQFEKEIARLRKNDPELTEIRWLEKKFTDAEISALAEVLKTNTALKYFVLYDVKLPANGVKAIAMALQNNTSISYFGLDKTSLGVDDMQAFAAMLEHNTTLTSLSLDECRPGPVLVEILAAALERNTTLKSLDLGCRVTTDSRMGAKGAKALAKALKQNTTLTYLNIYACHIEAEGEKALVEAMEQNTTLTRLGVFCHSNKNGEWDQIRLLEKRNQRLAEERAAGNLLASDKSSKGHDTKVAEKTDEKREKKAGREEPAITGSFEIANSDLKRFEKVGQGGFGVVYRGEWRRTPVAIKELHAINSKESIEEFQREGRIMVGLRHPNIVQFCGYCPDPRCLVMEWMPNGSLYSVLHSDRLLDPTMRYRFVVDIAKGLDFLHVCNPPILHRDLKSLNILLDEFFRAKISDFGLSKVKSETRATSTMGGAVGTPAWTAPELAERGAEYTPKADIFSFAVVMWEIYTRKIPFADAPNPGLIMMWIARGDREQIPKDCPKKIATLMAVCWKGRPEDRPDAKEIVDYLEDASREVFESKSEAQTRSVSASSASVASTSSAVYANLESQRSSLEVSLSS